MVYFGAAFNRASVNTMHFQPTFYLVLTSLVSVSLASGCPMPINEGEDGVLKFQYSIGGELLSTDWTPVVNTQKTVRVSLVSGGTVEVISAESLDQTVFEIEGVDGSDVSIRVIGEGRSKIVFNARNADGETVSDRFEFGALRATSLHLSHCSVDRQALFLAGQTGARFTFVMAAGQVPLMNEDYFPFRIEPLSGAKFSTYDFRRKLTYDLGGSEDVDDQGLITFRSDIDESFLSFGLTTADQYNGISFNPIKSRLIVSSGFYPILLFPAVDGVKVCDTGIIPEVKSLTPESCEAKIERWTGEPAMMLRGISTQVCRVEASFPMAELSDTFEFQFEPEKN